MLLLRDPKGQGRTLADFAGQIVNTVSLLRLVPVESVRGRQFGRAYVFHESSMLRTRHIDDHDLHAELCCLFRILGRVSPVQAERFV
jgi:hypothetical protein